jgi:hypothetical protein
MAVYETRNMTKILVGDPLMEGHNLGKAADWRILLKCIG